MATSPLAPFYRLRALTVHGHNRLRGGCQFTSTGYVRGHALRSFAYALAVNGLVAHVLDQPAVICKPSHDVFLARPELLAIAQPGFVGHQFGVVQFGVLIKILAHQKAAHAPMAENHVRALVHRAGQRVLPKRELVVENVGPFGLVSDGLPLGRVLARALRKMNAKEVAYLVVKHAARIIEVLG
jgi:hypothetical protein